MGRRDPLPLIRSSSTSKCNSFPRRSSASTIADYCFTDCHVSQMALNQGRVQTRTRGCIPTSVCKCRRLTDFPEYSQTFTCKIANSIDRRVSKQRSDFRLPLRASPTNTPPEALLLDPVGGSVSKPPSSPTDNFWIRHCTLTSNCHAGRSN